MNEPFEFTRKELEENSLPTDEYPHVLDLRGVEVARIRGEEEFLLLALRPPDYHGFPWIAYRVRPVDLREIAEKLLRALDQG